MKTLIFETKEKAAAYGADTVEEILREKPEAVFCLAAAIPPFLSLTSWQNGIPIFPGQIHRPG